MVERSIAIDKHALYEKLELREPVCWPLEVSNHETVDGHEKVVCAYSFFHFLIEDGSQVEVASDSGRDLKEILVVRRR